VEAISEERFAGHILQMEERFGMDKNEDKRQIKELESENLRLKKYKVGIVDKIGEIR
jgi:hypothetical protein